MSIASRIQEMETHIGNAYTSIDNLGIDISNTNKNIYNISALLDTFYDSLPKVSGIGASLSLSPTMVGKIKLNEIDGDTLQDGTPTPDSPVEIQSVTGLQNINIAGKNLFNDYATLTQTLGGITRTNVGDSIVFNGTYDKTANTDFWLTESNSSSKSNNATLLKANTSYTISISLTDGSIDNGSYNVYISSRTVAENTFNWNFKQLVFSDGKYVSSFTTTEDIYLGGIRFTFNTSQNATTFNNAKFKIQVEKGTTATTYEVYNGNTYEINLGKNLLPFTNQDFTLKGIHYYIQNGNLYFDGTSTGETYSTNQQFKDNFSFYLEAGTYTFSQASSNATTKYIDYFDTGTHITYINAGNKFKTFTLNEKTKVCLGFYVYNQTNDNELIDIQIEKGSQATSYSPYFTPIELNKIGDYQDSIKKSTGKNLYDPSYRNSNNNIDFVRCTGSEENGIYTMTATGSDMYFWYIVQSGNSYTSTSGFLFEFKEDAYSVTLTNNLFKDNYVTFYDENKISLGYVYKHSDKFTINKNEKEGAKYFSIRFGYATATVGQTYTTSIQLEENSRTTSYEPYLPKGTWYLKKQTHKVSLNISDMDNNENYPGWHDIQQIHDDFPGKNASFSSVTSFISNINGTAFTFGINTTTYGTLWIYKSVFNYTQTEWKTNFPDLVVSIVYGLQAPEYTEITNTELIEDLETLYTAKSYEGTTNINVSSENLPMIINASALKGED